MPIYFLAHAGHEHREASEVLRWWSFEPVVTATLAITIVMYDDRTSAIAWYLSVAGDQFLTADASSRRNNRSNRRGMS